MSHQPGKHSSKANLGFVNRGQLFRYSYGGTMVIKIPIDSFNGSTLQLITNKRNIRVSLRGFFTACFRDKLQTVNRTFITVFAFVILCLSALSDDTNRSRLIFVGDFESGEFKQFADARWDHTKRKCTIVKDPVRHGRFAARMTLDRKRDKQSTNYRTDLVPKRKGEGYLKQTLNQEYWYGFSTYFPNTWRPDTQSELFVQWHAVADKREGETARPPVLAIYIYGEDYYIKKRWDSKRNSNHLKIPHKKLWGGPITPDLGRWTDWVFHLKWSFGNDGFVKVWKNGKQIVSDNGPNCYNDERGPYFRFGVYKWPWRQSPERARSTVTERTIYFDEIRIGNQTAGYETVSPPSRKKDETNRLRPRGGAPNTGG